MATGNIDLRVSVDTRRYASMARALAAAIPVPVTSIGSHWSIHHLCTTRHLAPVFDPGDPTDALTVVRMSTAVDDPVDGEAW